MVAYAVLFSWPLVMLVLFRTLPVATALICSLLGAMLLLPGRTGVDLPMLPPINKGSLPVVTAIVLLMVMVSKTSNRLPGATHGTGARGLNMDYVLPGWLPRSKIILGLIALFFIGIFMTVLTNGDPQFYGPRVLRRMQIYDGLSNALQGIVMLLPLLVARKFLGHPDTHATFLRILCIAGVLYSLPALLEVRISPRLNLMVYGFQTQNWLQGVRGGGWRPTVFLSHGLVLAIVLAMCALAAVGYMRIADRNRRLIWMAVACWLMITLVLINSLGALVIFILLAPAVFLLKPRLQLICAACIAGVVLLYPMLRSADLVPVGRIVEIARDFDAARAGSLAYRFDNEDILLEKARERPLFGWGGWSRSRVFDDQGRDISTTDGAWVIILGVGGWAQYLMRFGVLSIPIIILALRRRGDPPDLATSVLALLLAANLVDLIPNSGNTTLTALIAGALIGRLEYRAPHSVAAEETTADPDDRRAVQKYRPPRTDQPPARPGYARRGVMSKISDVPEN